MVSSFKEPYLPCIIIIIIISSSSSSSSSNSSSNNNSSSSSNVALSEGCRIFSLTNSKLLCIILQEVLATISTWRVLNKCQSYLYIASGLACYMSATKWDHREITSLGEEAASESNSCCQCKPVLKPNMYLWYITHLLIHNFSPLSLFDACPKGNYSNRM